VLYASRLALFASLTVTGCRYMLGEPAPVPVELVSTPRAAPVEACEPEAPLPVPMGQTPLPTAEGELSLVDVRGDDRLAIDGGVVFSWTNDGEKIISGSNDGLRIWNASTGVMERHIAIPVGVIENPWRVILSPDEQRVAFMVYLRDSDPSKPSFPGFFLIRTDGQGPVHKIERAGGELSFSADSKRIVAFDREWDVETATVTPIKRPKFDHETRFLPGLDKALVFVSNDKPGKQSTIPELRDGVTGSVIHRFPEIQTSISSAISGDGKRIAFVHDGQLSVYSSETLQRVAFVPDIGKAQMVHLSLDGKRAVTEVLMCVVLLSSGEKSEYQCPKPEMTLWNLETAAPIWKTPNGSGDAWIFSPDGEYLTGPETRLVDYIIRLRDGKELKFGSRIRSISPGGKRIIYDDRVGFSVAALDGKSPVPSIDRSGRILARSADGRLILKVGKDNRVRLESDSSCLKLPIAVPVDYQRQAGLDYLHPEDNFVFSPDGSSLFMTISATSMGARYRALDTKTGAERWSIQVAPRSTGGIQILPLSNQVLFQGSQHPDLQRFNATTGERLPKGGMPRLIYYTPPDLGGLTYEVRGHEGIRAAQIYGVLAGKNGTRMAMSTILGQECAFTVWDVRNPRNVDDRFPGCMSMAKALSPDEKWVFAGTTEKRAMLIAMDHDETRFIPGMHEGKTIAVAYSPSGHRVILADDLGNITMADPQTLKVTGRARLNGDKAKSLWISPDSQTIVVDTNRDMIVRLRIGEKS